MMRPEPRARRFDPFDPKCKIDPYPCYHRFRTTEPVHVGEAPFPSFPRCHYVFRHADVVSVLKDRRLVRARPQGGGRGRPGGHAAVVAAGRRMVLFRDPPDHERMRSLLAMAFSPEFIRGLRPRVESVARRLLTAGVEKGEFDFMAEVAVPLPVLVIAAAMDLPEDDAGLIKAWSDDLIAVTDPRQSDRALGRAGAVARKLAPYLREVVAQRRHGEGDDLLSRMLHVRRDGRGLTDEEVIGNAMLLLSAGHETTTGLLGNGTLALLRQRREWERLREDPSLLPAATEELLRYDSAIQMTFRFARERIELGGHVVEEGDAVAAVIGSANRDPDVFADPDRLDVGRAVGRHIAFGAGTHFCMGPALARLEAQTMLGRLLDWLPELELAGEPVWRDTIAFRALDRLPVNPGAGAGFGGRPEDRDESAGRARWCPGFPAA